MKSLSPITAIGISLALSVEAVRAEGKPGDAEVTFSEHVAPVIFGNCASCHRPGEAAPFALTSYAEVAKRGRMIKAVTSDGSMPPWHPVEGHGEFANERRLERAEIEMLAAWVDAGMPEGDPEKTPAFPHFPVGWQLGEPDLVVTMEEGFEVSADGPDIYRQFAVPLALPEGKWVRAVEVRPSEGGALHHVLIYLDATGSARRLDAADPVPGFRGMGFRRTGSLGGWAVGAGPKELPGGLAMELPAGSDIVLSSHFHPTGKRAVEKTKIGLFFAEKAPERRLLGIQLPPNFGARAGIDIPAGESAYTVRDSVVLPVDTELISVGGHMHYLGKKARAVAVLPDGTSRNLFYIDDWDFSWQDSYRYREPVRLPGGTRVDVELTWDNSAQNPHNPFDPPRRVRWGRESTDEMGSISFVCVAANRSEHGELARALGGRFSSLAGGGNADAGSAGSPEGESLMRRFEAADRNGDGVLSGSELPETFRAGELMKLLDRDGDGTITRAEVEGARADADSAAVGDYRGILRRLDTDGDGRLRGEEIPARLREGLLMRYLDKDGDGEIVLEELPATVGESKAVELLRQLLDRKT